jgi:hypothetical protein
MIDLALSIVLAIATWRDPLSVFAPTPEHQPRPPAPRDEQLRVRLDMRD